jgi:hypothetical protein
MKSGNIRSLSVIRAFATLLLALCAFAGCRFHEVITFDHLTKVPEVNGSWKRESAVERAPDIVRMSVYDLAPSEHVVFATAKDGSPLHFDAKTYTEDGTILAAYRVLEFDSKDPKFDVVKIEVAGDTLRAFFIDDHLFPAKKNVAAAIKKSLQEKKNIFLPPLTFKREPK